MIDKIHSKFNNKINKYINKIKPSTWAPSEKMNQHTKNSKMYAKMEYNIFVTYSIVSKAFP